MTHALFPVLPGIGGMIQFYYPKLPVVCALLAMETLIIHLNSLDQQVSLDGLTGLNNRKQFLLAVGRKVKNRRPGNKLYILMIDVNRFKQINDTYGHLEGDRALCRMAEVLRVAAEDLRHRATVARYGGDEFIILVESEDQAEPERLKERIVRLLAEDGKKHASPYEITTSIGIASSDEGDSIRAMIAAADQKLYEEKKIAHEKDGGGKRHHKRKSIT